MLRVGLVGVGYLGTRHLNHLSTLENVTVSAVWDISPEALQTAANAFKVPAAASLDDLIAKSDAVVVVAPTTAHFEIGMAVIDAGKPLFIEKPICATAAEGMALVEAGEAKNVPIQVGHIERFNRGFRALKNLAIHPRFVEIHRLAQWNPRGGDVAVVHDLMIHDLDLLLTLAGCNPGSIHASGVGVVTPSIDIANARLEFPTGLVANVTASRISLKQMRKLRLFGEHEYIALDLGKGTCEYVGAEMGFSNAPLGDLIPGVEILGEMEMGARRMRLFRRFPEAPEGDAMRLELSAFRDAVLNGSEPLVTGRDGLKALELAEAILVKIKEGHHGFS